MSSETISGLEVNFSNGGGSHSATVTSIVGARLPNGSLGLGSIRGRRGERSNFSEEKIEEFLKNFILIEETRNVDAVKTSITRKYSDRTSLLLKSNVLLVRGINASPNADLDFKGYVPHWGEVANAPNPNEWSFPKLEAVRSGATVIIGGIYNTSTEDVSLPIVGGGYEVYQASLVYRKQQLQEKLCQNLDRIPERIKRNPDLTGFSLKYGYTLNDFKSAVSLLGLKINGLPFSGEPISDILFEYSGTFESVISSIASAIGYYWYVDPSDGEIKMIDSKIASLFDIQDPSLSANKDDYISTSYTESELSPCIINTYVGSPRKNGPEGGDIEIKKRVRATNFNRVFFDVSAGKLNKKTIGYFFGLFLSGQFTEENFVKLALIILSKEKIAGAIFGDQYPYSSNIGSLINIPFARIQGYKSETKSNNRLATNSEVIGDRSQATYHHAITSDNETFPRSELHSLYKLLETFYNNCGGIGISNGFSKYKADRCSFINSAGSTIVGPFEKTKKLKRIEQLKSLDAELTKLGYKNLTIQNLADYAKQQARLPYFFLSFRNPLSFSKLNKEEELEEGGDLNYDFLEDDVEIYSVSNINGEYVGGKNGWDEKASKNITASIKFWEDFIRDKRHERFAYTISASPINTEEIDEDPQESSEGGSEANEKLQQLLENIDLKIFKINQGGADGTPTKPVSLNSQSGSTVDMEILSKYNELTPNEEPLKSSSKTIYGLDIPEFKPTISSVSVSVGSEGVTTTISESTIKMIPIDRQIFIDSYNKTSISNNIISRLGAGARNFLKV